MRKGFDHAALAALGIALIVDPGPAAAEPAPGESTEVIPAGIAPGSAPSETDPLYDEDFDLESDGSRIDPFEGANRSIMLFNQQVDTFLLEPLTTGYRFLVPRPARRSIRNVFLNLNSPSILVNDLLQLRFRDAAETAGRFVLNTTVGWGGLFDAGKAAGWERHESDFGQTLALAGVKSGPYLVLPLMGPSTVRDGLGDVVDRFFQPLTYFLGPGQQLILGGGSGFTTRAAYAEELAALEASSVDFYAALRSVYLQSRRAEIWGHTSVSGNGNAGSRGAAGYAVED
jgi:phospholipid-binding lipoprotein MlaA